jgi:arsenate reductase-like glutaredoxin family protein
MYKLAGSYEALFSRRAMLFRQRGLHEKKLAEKDYKNLILEHYTFLKRPVIIVDGQIFIGNSKKVVEAAVAAIDH